MAAEEVRGGVALRCCPFCSNAGTDERGSMATDGVTHWVICRKCGGCGPVSHAKGSAITAWNHRGPAAAQDAEGVLRERVAIALCEHQHGRNDLSGLKPWWGERKDQPAGTTLVSEVDRAMFRDFADAALSALAGAGEREGA